MLLDEKKYNSFFLASGAVTTCGKDEVEAFFLFCREEF